MEYLIFDVAFWVYLAKGNTAITDRADDQSHFKLLGSLIELKKEKKVSVLINDFILQEWSKNKQHSLSKINLLKERLRRAEHAVNYILKCKEKTRSEFKEKLQKMFSEEISLQENHIRRMDFFLNYQCIRVATTEAQKNKVFDLVINHKAPFHHKNNNYSDAILLFGADDYLKLKVSDKTPSAFFLSYNRIDFAYGDKFDTFHPDILERLSVTGINYQYRLPESLNLAVETRLNIEHYFKYYSKVWVTPFACKMEFCEGNKRSHPWDIREIPVKDAAEIAVLEDNGNRGSFSAHEKSYPHIKMGDCAICETTHLECPCCKEIIYTIEKGADFTCNYCFATLQLTYKQSFNHPVLWIIDKGLND